MTSKNDITGDKIQTKGILSKEGEENFDRIFKKKSRIDTVGQNGNDGIHYEYELDKSTGEVVKVDVKKLTDAFNGH
jgi:hypothetical protein